MLSLMQCKKTHAVIQSAAAMLQKKRNSPGFRSHYYSHRFYLVMDRGLPAVGVPSTSNALQHHSARNRVPAADQHRTAILLFSLLFIHHRSGKLPLSPLPFHILSAVLSISSGLFGQIHISFWTLPSLGLTIIRCCSHNIFSHSQVHWIRQQMPDI